MVSFTATSPATPTALECMRSLYRMNITNATLFPDLDGLAKSIAFELEIIWKGLVAEPQASDSRGDDRLIPP